MNAIQLSQTAVRNQRALCQYWLVSAKPRPVWALFSDRYGLLSWTLSKHNARKILGVITEQNCEPLWLVKIVCP